jgi:carbamoyltransferase
MYILGLSCYFHDSAAALLRDGELVAAAQEERFSRRKHDSVFPARAVEFCLRHAAITGRDLDHVVFYEKPLLKFERILLSILASYPRSWKVFREAMIGWSNEKLWIRSILSKKLQVPKERVLFVEHHLSHAASALFCSPFREAAVISVDGVGEWTTAAVGRGQADWGGSRNELILDHEIRFPHSLGLLYSAFTAFLGFEVNEGEYKVMGMAPYGQPRYVDRVRKLINVNRDGSFTLNMEYFCYHYSDSKTFNGNFEHLFGAPRDPNDDFVTPLTQPGVDPSAEVVRRSQYYADVAASIQVVVEDVMLAMARDLHARTGLRNLCMAGGVALNSVANGRILRETPFEALYVQPAAGDAGGALGAALYVWHVMLQKPRSFVMEHCLWGALYPEGEIRHCLEQSGLSFEQYDEDGLLDRTAAELERSNVVGWFQGRFEWGPRALGNRSILADPRRAEMKEIVNTKVKFREPFRPFAPVVLAERVGEYFEGQGLDQSYPAQFMLLVTPVRENKRAVIPAVTHADGSGRLQVVRRHSNPRFYGLIERFAEATGVPVLLNTSFNLRGEPIVASPEDAVKTFASSGIDLLVLDRFVVRKSGLSGRRS